LTRNASSASTFACCIRTKFYTAIVLLSLIALLVGACSGEPSPAPGEVSSTPGLPITDLKVRDATEARDVALAYLQEHEPQNAPSAGIIWQEEDVTPRDKAGHPVPRAVHKEF